MISRQELLEQILQRICRIKTLNYEVINDLLQQLKAITTTRGDEESSLLFIVQMARKELKKAKKMRPESERSASLRKVLSGITSDLTNHLRIYFPGPMQSDQV